MRVTPSPARAAATPIVAGRDLRLSFGLIALVWALRPNTSGAYIW